ncbi:anaerobic sulfatase maturase [Atlantibacter sp.]|uniref:anaerobic sulfatase maturase n=1 Tax=Atlantibacter sp. TaxID=1903473 RepID=UPI0028A7A809|nr:anaerobic sulfatase maturase [Atlantibacter sp.]
MKSCHLMVKPTGALCNLGCDYCFYLDKARLYPQRHSRCMDDETLSRLVQQQIAAQDTDEVIFAWQGGEPTLAGLAFFQRAVALQQQFAQGKTIINTFQTNGILLDDAWCRFFRQHQFLIGISLDGDAALHDAYRKTNAGKPTHHKVETAVKLLQKHGVAFNTLTVVNALNSQHPQRVYDYLKKLGSRHMQFIPLLETTEEGVSERSLKPADFGIFLKTIFYQWVRHDIGLIEVPVFEHAFAVCCGLPALSCVFAPTCGSAFALELNGDLYQCDHFVSPQFLLGNLHQNTLREMLDSDANRMFGHNKSPLASECAACKVRSACHGGCPKDRIALSSDSPEKLNYFCPSYQAFFRFVQPYMLMMKSLIEQGYSPSDIRHYVT